MSSLMFQMTYVIGKIKPLHTIQYVYMKPKIIWLAGGWGKPGQTDMWVGGLAGRQAINRRNTVMLCKVR